MALIRDRALIFGKQDFKLASGGSSNFFFDMRNLSFDYEGASENLDSVEITLIPLYTRDDFGEFE